MTPPRWHQREQIVGPAWRRERPGKLVADTTDRPGRMIELHINGEAHRLPQPCTLGELLQRLDLQQRRVAAELNGWVIPRSQHGACVLADGDRLELVHAIGGG